MLRALIREKGLELDMTKMIKQSCQGQFEVYQRLVTHGQLEV